MTQQQYRNILAGDPAPWFRQRTLGGTDFNFDNAAGRYLVLCFYMSAADEAGRNAIAAARELRDIFNDATASLFGVSCDPGDVAEQRITETIPGFRHFVDGDYSVAKLYGAAPLDAQGRFAARRFWVVADPTLRVMKVIPFAADGSDRTQLQDFMRSLPPPSAYAGIELQAPVLMLPNVFEPELCQQLIGLYDAAGGMESGVTRSVDGKTVVVQDRGFKRRRDRLIEDQTLVQQLQSRFIRRVVPEIQKAHQFKVTRMERYLVACYSAEEEGHFRAHRDNTTAGTAHRRFAVSVNLNDDFDGGEVSFPEYGPRSFKAPPGGAVVFSCSLLHAVSKVTQGRRYAFLPFLYDDEAAKIRTANNQFLDPSIGAYTG